MCVFANKLGSVRAKEGMRLPFDVGVERARKQRKKKRLQMCQWALTDALGRQRTSGG